MNQEEAFEIIMSNKHDYVRLKKINAFLESEIATITASRETYRRLAKRLFRKVQLRDRALRILAGHMPRGHICGIICPEHEDCPDWMLSRPRCGNDRVEMLIAAALKAAKEET